MSELSNQQKLSIIIEFEMLRDAFVKELTDGDYEAIRDGWRLFEHLDHPLASKALAAALEKCDLELEDAAHLAIGLLKSYRASEQYAASLRDKLDAAVTRGDKAGDARGENS